MTSVITTIAHHTIAYFCELTRAIYDVEDHYLKPIQSDPEGWWKLANLWSRLSDGYGTCIFHDAVSYIKYSKYSYDSVMYNDVHQALIQAVCCEICSDTLAGSVWRKHAFFKRALREAEPESDHSYCLRMFSEGEHYVSTQHCFYLYNRLMLRIWRAKGVCDNKCKSASTFIEKYEQFITTICPSAAAWTSEYWVDANHIYTALDHQCGFNYRTSLNQYDALMLLLRMCNSAYTITGDEDYDITRCICNLQYFSLSMAKALWPSNTEGTVVRLLSMAAERAHELALDDSGREDILRPCCINDVDYDLLLNSGLYSLMETWTFSAEFDPRYVDKAKRVLFDINLKV